MKTVHLLLRKNWEALMKPKRFTNRACIEGKNNLTSCTRNHEALDQMIVNRRNIRTFLEFLTDTKFSIKECRLCLDMLKQQQTLIQYCILVTHKTRRTNYNRQHNTTMKRTS